MKYVIGTRGSKLALRQAEYVCSRLKEQHPEDEFEIKVIRTTGDMVQDKPLDKIGTKGLFVSQIEEEILAGTVHIGVHSMKDMPSYPEKGLAFTKAWTRQDPRDALILREANCLDELPKGAVIATGSKRRAFQLLSVRPDLNIVGIRGNVDTRIRKMHEQQLDGIVLAVAGLKRLDMESVITEYLDFMVPAPAQGTLALEIREDNSCLREMLDSLSDPDCEFATRAERGFLQEIGADCHVPVGAVCMKTNKEFVLKVMFGNESGSKMAYAEVSGTDPEYMAKEAAVKVRQKMAGTVHLVGGGPGDAELITVKGMKLIEHADCIIYDRLAPQEVLEHAHKDCELIYCGKADSHHTMKQEEINSLLVKKALEYNCVVRLKGGDPFVFGRGGEEALYLIEKGIPFQVVPGVTSAVSAPALGGIPVTHRGISEGFRVVTAHDRHNNTADLDFASMAECKETLVFLMGLSKLGDICTGLLDAGIAPDMPAAVVSKASAPEQRVIAGTVGSLVSLCEKEKPESPAVIVVGEVVKLSDKLAVRTSGKLLTVKVGDEESGVSTLLKAGGFSVTELTAGRITPVENTIDHKQLEGFDAIAFTSRSGVRCFFDALLGSGLDTRALSGMLVAAVGPSTAEVLTQYGLKADIIPDEYSGKCLAEAIKKAAGESAKVLYPCGKVTSGSLEAGLSHVNKLVCYENVAAGNELQIATDGFDGIIFTCSSSAERFFEVNSPEHISCNVYCIGEATARTVKKYVQERVYISSSSDYRSLSELVCRIETN